MPDFEPRPYNHSHDPRDLAGDAAAALQGVVDLIADAGNCEGGGRFEHLRPDDLAAVLKPIAHQLRQSVGALVHYVPRDQPPR